MSEKPKRRPYKKRLKADDKGATLEEVVRAVLKYRPEEKGGRRRRCGECQPMFVIRIAHACLLLR